MASIVARKNAVGEVTGWQVKVRRRGHAPVSRTFVRRADAERYARQVEAEMDRGVFVPTEEAEAVTLGEALDRYLREVSIKKKGHAQEASRIRLWKEYPLSKRSLATIRATDIAKYRDERLEAGASAATVRLDLAVISHLYTIAAKEWGLPVRNPVASVRLPQANNARNRRLDADEEARLMASLAQSRNPYILAFVQLALETAMRRGELLALQWENVDLKRRVAHLPATKNGEARTVPLSSRAVAILQDLPRSIDGRVFATTSVALKFAWISACKRAGIDDLHFHDLRHEATSRLAEKLPNVVELSAVTGHKDLRMLKRYYHPRAEDLARKIG
ncbi:integrase [Sulfuricystis thermophila]|uniref:integrase n=1 Tax=Sulfuricystis thermophila TaxID=2496847 RepID=UPI001035B7B8|nr:site-specific integrase [Sulfuricystis thermophila]